MTDIPILFNGPMVLAQLEGRKTMTRRLAWKPVKKGPVRPADRVREFSTAKSVGFIHERPSSWQKVKPGDRLYPRETLRYDWKAHCWRYDADKAILLDTRKQTLGTPTPTYAPRGVVVSIHMPRWASRITWIVTDVKMEPVQDISEEDALAEGIVRSDPTREDLEWYRNWAPERGIDPATDPMQPVWLAPGTKQGWGLTKEERNRPQWGPTPEFAFRCLWDSLHGKSGNGWADNPEVVAITAEVYIRNIDDMEKAA